MDLEVRFLGFEDLYPDIRTGTFENIRRHGASKVQIEELNTHYEYGKSLAEEDVPKLRFHLDLFETDPQSLKTYKGNALANYEDCVINEHYSSLDKSD